ncbi:beta-lactamase-like protein [Klebsiella pneumoniae]|uniref:Beta-lactamase-like protein n=1 Tax=Klebsiella pneumoniae TaxID=573 RepID=A0A377TWD2_KLEPN|nr:beta-lactamase-like protein [Klebsiella pneumoniae]
MPLFPNARYLCSAKELSRVKNSERYRALWLDSLLPVIEAGQLETVDVATRPRVGDGSTLFPPPGHSPDHAALVLAAGDDYAVSPAIFCIPRSSLPIRSGIQRSAAIPGRRKSRDGR